ncbi:AraC family transcriptional regulator [Curtobacterium flaccumfaciens]|uniref:AraC family transcriptional regulator n=1 Tax=Curtobacterium flaccumfaciens TaxID=2035 RepID=UPI001366CB64|nr:AraC family transcriptional regulator [Curtobacterium flaccumfaciens]MBT1664946.1 AraC family transcriptional regulator [Curtobacterium flaccumfaciens pv. flaccumfaciens]QHN62849.1 AraC family transcriptional regulator [Curtobacterium flaccumfaciens pv. flaccumfaciens]
MPELMHRTQRVTQTADPAVAADAIARTHAAHAVDVDPGGAAFAFEERVRGTHLLSLETTACTGVVSGTIESDSAMVLVWLKSGSGAIDGRPVPIGRPVLYRNEPQQVRFESFQKDVIRIDRATVEQVAAQRGEWAPGPLEFHPHHVPEGPTLAAWWLMVRTVAAEVIGGPDVVSEERERQLARFAAGGLLTAIPHWPVGQHAPPTTAGTRFARAEAFLLDHAREPITVADIAAAAGLSVRGVQAAFNRHHGITPLAYLRHIRLLLARERLESDPELAVAEVARWAGFGHLGRFAGAYRDEFGELPRQTLQASRP